MTNNETSALLPSSSPTPTTANNRRRGSSRLTAAVGQTVAAILVVIGVAIIFCASHHDRASLQILPFLGKSNHHTKKQNKARKRLSDNYQCEKDDKYSKITLKRAYELPYAALFKDHRGQKKVSTLVGPFHDYRRYLTNLINFVFIEVRSFRRHHRR